MQKKILILGGGGFIGSNLAAKIAKTNPSYHITIADKFFNKNTLLEFYNLNNVKIINCDLTKFESFTLFDLVFDDVYMLASIVGVNPTLNDPLGVLIDNSTIINNVIKWLDKVKIKKLLFSSTSEVYAGAIEHFKYNIPTDESVPIVFHNIKEKRFSYAVTKAYGESVFLNAAFKYKFNCAIIRYHNVYGPNMGFKHVIPHLVERFLKNENPFIIYGPHQTRSFSFIDDSVNATNTVMDLLLESEIIHIGTEEEVSIEYLTKTVGEILGISCKYIYSNAYPGSVNRRCPDVTLLNIKYNFVSKTKLKEGLIKTVNWYKDYFYQFGFSNHQNGFYPPSNS